MCWNSFVIFYIACCCSSVLAKTSESACSIGLRTVFYKALKYIDWKEVLNKTQLSRTILPTGCEFDSAFADFFKTKQAWSPRLIELLKRDVLSRVVEFKTLRIGRLRLDMTSPEVPEEGPPEDVFEEPYLAGAAKVMTQLLRTMSLVDAASEIGVEYINYGDMEQLAMALDRNEIDMTSVTARQYGKMSNAKDSLPMRLQFAFHCPTYERSIFAVMKETDYGTLGIGNPVRVNLLQILDKNSQNPFDKIYILASNFDPISSAFNAELKDRRLQKSSHKNFLKSIATGQKVIGLSLHEFTERELSSFENIPLKGLLSHIVYPHGPLFGRPMAYDCQELENQILFGNDWEKLFTDEIIAA